jgi:hypothetical protein
LKLDGNVYFPQGQLAASGPPQLDPPHQFYMTKRGVNLFIPGGANVGDVVHTLVAHDGNPDGIMEPDEIYDLANATSVAV